MQSSHLDPLRQVQFLSSVLLDEQDKALALGDAPGSSGEASGSESDEVSSDLITCFCVLVDELL
jgi:hypothetical protein